MFTHPIHSEMIDPTSKIALKLSCLAACDNNVGRAKELYEFLADGMDAIPDVEPVRPSGLDQVRQGASDVLGWFSEHRDEVSQGIAFIQSLRRPAAKAVAEVPPIPKP